MTPTLPILFVFSLLKSWSTNIRRRHV